MMAALKKPKLEDLEFQMVFYEGIVRQRPDFIDVLIVLGEIYTKKRLYEKGLKVDKKLSKLRPQSPIIHYNLACSFSLVGDTLNSFKAIKRAILLGYDDFIFMDSDPDLSNLRRDDRFTTFVKKIRKGSSNTQNAGQVHR